MKQAKNLLFIMLLVATVSVQAQVGIGTPTPNASAQLDVSSTSKGFLPPRLTSEQRDAIESPAEGLVIYNTNTLSLEFFAGYGWISLTPPPSAVFLPTIVIGFQQWMAKNLDVAFYRNGEVIPQVTDPTEWAALTTGAWCYYNNDSTRGTSYGKLYNWYAVNDSRGLAPVGWHIPSDAEWTVLGNRLGGSSVAGGKMKEAGVLHWASPNTGGNNNSGWAGLPGGNRYLSGLFSSVTGTGIWWSATENLTTNAWNRTLFYTDGSLINNVGPKYYGFSVRCLRD